MAKDLQQEFEQEIDLSDQFEQEPEVQKLSVLDRLENSLKKKRTQARELAKAIAVPIKETAEDFGKGAVQGGTLGFAEELGAGEQALLDKLMATGHNIAPSMISESPTQVSARLASQGITGDVGPTDTTDLYRQAQTEEEQRYKQSEERSPVASFMGNLVGGIPIMTATGGLGTAGKVTKAIPALGKNLLGKITAGAIESIPAGAVIGAGMSKGRLIDATPEEQEQLATETVGGAIMAPLISSAFHLATSGVKEPIQNAFSKYIKERPAIRQLELARKAGQEGQGFTTESEIAKLTTDVLASTDETVNRIMQADKKLGQDVGKSISDATEAGKTIVISDDVMNAAKQADEAVSRNSALSDDPVINETFLSLKDTMKKGQQLKPDELRTVRDNMDDVLDRLEGDTSTLANATRKIVSNFRNKIVTKLKDEIPAYREASERFDEFRKMIPETIISRGFKPEVTRYRVGSMKNPTLKLTQATNNMIGGATRTGSATETAQNTFNILKNNVNKLDKSEVLRKAEAAAKGESFQDIFELMGYDTKQNMIDTITKKADEASMKRHLLGFDPQAGFSQNIGSVLVTGRPKPTGRAATTVAANYLGQGQRAASNIAKSPINLAKKLYTNVDENYYRRMAEKLKIDPSTGSIGQALENALSKNDSNLKNAAIFTALQNPKARQILQEEDTNE